MAVKKRTLTGYLLPYGIQSGLVLFLANFALVYTVIKFGLMAQNCLTVAQVQADSRCLLIAGNKVYEMGTQPRPHHGHTCGSNVSGLLPASHLGNMMSYLDPRYRADICPDYPPTNTPPPPTDTPVMPTDTLTPTKTPVPTATTVPGQPTFTPMPTATKTPVPTITLIPTATRTPVPTKTPVPTATITPAPMVVLIPEIIPTNTNPPPIPTLTPQPATKKWQIGLAAGVFFTELSAPEWWGVVLMLASMATLVLSILLGILKYLIFDPMGKRKNQKVELIRPTSLSTRGNGGIVEDKLFYIKPYSRDEINNIDWYQMSSNEGIIFGIAREDNITEGVYRVFGKKTMMGSNSCIRIEKIIPFKKEG